MNQAPQPALWFVSDRSRYFLIPLDIELDPGDAVLIDLLGRQRAVDIASLTPFEVSNDQMRRWAKYELGQTLDELKQGMEEKLNVMRRDLDVSNRRPVSEGTTVTPNAAPALVDLLKKLPSVVGNSLSGDDKRIESAKTAMAKLQQRLKEAGIDVDTSLTDFPDRLAGLRKDLSDSTSADKPKKDDPPADKP